MPNEAYVGPMMPMSPRNSRANTASSGPKVTGSMSRIVNTAIDAYSNMSPEMQAAVNSKASQVGRAIGGKFSGGGGKSSSSSSGNNNNNGGRKSGRPSGSSGNSGNGIIRAPNPSSVKLSTGIASNCYVNDYMTAEANKCSPMHVKCIKIAIPTAATNDLYLYWNRIISSNVQMNAQFNVGFAVPLNDLSNTNILNGFNDVLLALFVYYFYTSITTYNSNFFNQNEGMGFLRRLINPTSLDSLQQLQAKLHTIPIPPAMLEMVRYLSSNFLSGDNPGSPILKFSPFQPSSTLLDDAKILTCLDALSTDANNKMFSILRRCVPEWVPSNLPDVPVNPIFDAQFLTLFSNAPKTYYTGTTQYYFPAVTDTSTLIEYSGFDNTLDGLIYSLLSMWNSTSSSWTPGLIEPLYTSNVTAGSSLMSFIQVSGVSTFKPTFAYPYVKIGMTETYTLSDTNAVLTPHCLGSYKVQGVTALSVKDNCLKTLAYMMSLDKLKASTSFRGLSKK